MKFEKNPGPDWVVEYKWLGEGEFERMSIFGMANAEMALDQARWSLDLAESPYAIIGVWEMRDER